MPEPDIIAPNMGSYEAMLNYGLSPRELFTVPPFEGFENPGIYQGHPTDPGEPPVKVADVSPPAEPAEPGGIIAPAGVAIVTPSGDDDTGEVGGKPFKTIQAAVNASNSSTRVWVFPGTYNEDVSLGSNKPTSFFYFPGASHGGVKSLSADQGSYTALRIYGFGATINGVEVDASTDGQLLVWGANVSALSTSSSGTVTATLIGVDEIPSTAGTFAKIQGWSYGSNGARFRFFGLPTSASGLPAGTVWNDSGTLKVAS